MITLEQIKERFPHIAFNDDPAKRNKDHYLFQLDTAQICPENYDIKNLKLYKGVITWNPKVFQQMTTWGANAYKIGEYPRFGDYGLIDEFTPISDKEGICMFQHEKLHDMSFRQTDLFIELFGMSHFSYGSEEFGGIHNRGPIGSKHEKLAKLNKTRFSICFENVYHPLWSHNYISEHIFDCFRAKTIPVYLGAYNIDEIVPSAFFINYKEFRTADELAEHMLEINDDVYKEIVDKSYQWALQHQWNSDKFIQALSKLK